MGLVIAIVCAFFQSAKDLVSKKLAFSVSGVVSAFASFVFALPFYAVLLFALWAAGLESFIFSSRFIQYVVIRSITDVAAEWLKMSALRRGEISLLACFFNLGPLFLLVTSPLITGDQTSPLGVLAVVTVVAGSLITVYDPNAKGTGGFSAQKSGIGLALLSAFFMSLNSCFDRLAALEASPVLSGFAMTALSAVFLLPFVIARGVGSELRGHYKPFFIRGALETIFMITKIWALQYMNAPSVIAIQRVNVVFTVIGGRVLYNEKQFGRRLAGAIVVLAGVLMTIFAL